MEKLLSLLIIQQTIRQLIWHLRIVFVFTNKLKEVLDVIEL